MSRGQGLRLNLSLERQAFALRVDLTLPAQGITVNMVLPGRINTDRLQFLDEARAKRENTTAHEVSEKMKAAIPAKRYGNPNEYGDVVAFLASTRASYITGSMIRVDGGAIASV